MDLRTQVTYFRKEHQDILTFLASWEHAVSQVASGQDAERLKGLADLRSMEPQLAAIEGHCRSEEKNVESPYSLYLEDAQLEELKKEHDQLRRFLQNVLFALRFATLAHVEEVAQLGRELLQFVRSHIAYEEKLLAQIEQGRAAVKELELRYTEPGE